MATSFASAFIHKFCCFFHIINIVLNIFVLLFDFLTSLKHLGQFFLNSSYSLKYSSLIAWSHLIPFFNLYIVLLFILKLFYLHAKRQNKYNTTELNKLDTSFYGLKCFLSIPHHNTFYCTLIIHNIKDFIYGLYLIFINNFLKKGDKIID